MRHQYNLFAIPAGMLATLALLTAPAAGGDRPLVDGRARRSTMVRRVGGGGVRSEAIKWRHPMAFHMNWLRLIRFLTQYVAPGLAAVVVVAEIMGWLVGAPMLHSLT